MRTIEQLSREALDVQDACNLLAVLNGFSRAVRDLREILGNEGWDAVNNHAICVLWSSKIASLTGSEVGMSFSHAYDACCELASPISE